jgi:hypothetical protein
LPNGDFASFHDAYRRKPFLEGLRERGWVEGRNVTIERRFAAGQADRLPVLAAELVALDVEVILAAATPAAMAARNATSRIAIVMADPGDAVELGLVASLARPGANITGVTSLAPELATKRLALLKEAFPKTTHVAVLCHTDRIIQPCSDAPAITWAVFSTEKAPQISLSNGQQNSTDHQPQNCERVWVRCCANAASPCRRGDRIVELQSPYLTLH